MPTNLYGLGSIYDLNNSHALPSLLRKFHEAKVSESSEVTVGEVEHLLENSCIVMIWQMHCYFY